MDLNGVKRLFCEQRDSWRALNLEKVCRGRIEGQPKSGGYLGFVRQERSTAVHRQSGRMFVGRVVLYTSRECSTWRLEHCSLRLLCGVRSAAIARQELLRVLSMVFPWFYRRFFSMVLSTVFPMVLSTRLCTAHAHFSHESMPVLDKNGSIAKPPRTYHISKVLGAA